MDLNAYIAQFKDPYERKARLMPGLLVIAPVLVSLVVDFGLKHPVLAAAGTILGTCGGMYGLASIVRNKGKEIEETLVDAWGGMPTTIALRHRDKFLDSVSKQRYHELIARKLAIPMPTSAEEQANPAKADDVYVGATKRLRELTRNDRGLLFKENIAYGFQRNMVGMKPAGIFICLVGLLSGCLQAKAITLRPPYFLLPALANADVRAWTTLAVSLVFLSMWLFYISPATVRRIGFTYAERLFERLQSVRGSGGSH